MKGLLTSFSRLYVAFAVCVGVGNAFAATAENPRSATLGVPRAARSDARTISRNNGVLSNVISRGSTNRSGASVVSRGATNSRAATTVRATVSRSATNATPATVSRAATGTARSAKPASVSRSAVSHGTQNARAATGGNIKIKKAGLSRAAARATAVFSDISKIGGGYAQCRESYATCMDQFCANANDTYRRCYCSSRFTEFRDMELAFDASKQLLQRFEDNNLNAVDKTAAEVNAMYSATVGEAAIKNDVSGAQSVLNEIGDLLSGKKKVGQEERKSSVLDGPINFDMDDLWGNTESFFDSMAGGTGEKSLSEMEGGELYSASHKQCMELVADSCQSEAVLNMAVSSYNIMITQDCNLYEKKIDSQREALMTTVRQAEKYLREARLEEYRSHNSADVNECIEKVRDAMLQDTACGANYNRCLDYTGVYISPTTGEPVFSQRFFQLNQLIELDGTSADVLEQNDAFNDFLDQKKMFATTALDSCRDIADTVWYEFKRSALIEIAQAQDVKIEEVKTSCVETMAECYDKQTGDLKTLNTESSAQYTGALSARAARDMCADKVTACAALYGDADACKFDGNGKLLPDPEGGKCGLSSLLKLVESVDTIKINEGCAAGITKFLQDMCTPDNGDKGYPWNCRMKTPGDVSENPEQVEGRAGSIAQNLVAFAVDNCGLPDSSNVDAASAKYSDLDREIQLQIERALDDLKTEVDIQLDDACTELGGYWQDGNATGNDLTGFNSIVGDVDKNWGQCIENTAKTRCLGYNEGGQTEVATYDLKTDECIFTDEWFKSQCSAMGGYFEDDVCYIPEQGSGEG